MKAPDIMLDLDYVVVLAPRHRVVKDRRVATVRRRLADGRRFEVVFPAVRPHPPIAAAFGSPAPADMVVTSVIVDISQFVESSAARADRMAAEAAAVRRWDDYPEHARRAAEAQRAIDAEKRPRRPFPSRTYRKESADARAS